MDSTNTRFAQNYRIKKGVIKTPLYPDESISSWLIRAALDCGTEPLTFTRFYWNSYRLWTYDLDRGFESIDDSIYKDITTLSLNHAVRLKNHSLHAFLEVVNRNGTLVKGQAKWVIARAARNRIHHIGQQYCPCCLDEKPYLQNQWRIAWHFGCLKHKVLLKNKCFQCGTAYQPHRLSAYHRTLNYCHYCKMQLTLQSEALNSVQIATLQSLNMIFCQNTGICLEQTVSAEIYFKVLRYVINLLRRTAFSKHTQSIAQFIELLIPAEKDACFSKTGLAFELLTISERINLLVDAHIILNVSKKKMITAIQQSGITQRTLAFEAYPDVLNSLFQHALVGKTVKVRSRAYPQKLSLQALNRKWERLKRKLHID